MEEYDGMNADTAKFLVIQVNLPMLVRGHAIQTKVLDDILSLRVPNLYKLAVGLPCSILENSTASYFDCKIRKLIIAMPVRRIEEVIEEPSNEVFEPVPKPAPAAKAKKEEKDEPKIYEIEEKEEPRIYEIVDEEPSKAGTDMNTDDLLFDVM